MLAAPDPQRCAELVDCWLKSAIVDLAGTSASDIYVASCDDDGWKQTPRIAYQHLRHFERAAPPKERSAPAPAKRKWYG